MAIAAEEAFVELLTVTRVRDGAPVPTDMVVRLDGSTLIVTTDWNDKAETWKTRRVYAVRELATDWAGRGFSLAKEGGEESYEVFVSDDGPHLDVCDCRGSTRFGYCVHRDSLRHLCDSSHI